MIEWVSFHARRCQDLAGRMGAALAMLMAMALPMAAHSEGQAPAQHHIQGQDQSQAASKAESAQASLRQSLAAAWQRHPQATALAARQAQAQARAEVASGLTPGPASVSLGQKTDRLHHNTGQREWELELATPLWLPSQQTARRAEADRNADELAARTEWLRWQLAGEVREAWWAVAGARAAQRLARQRADTAEALAATVQQRYAKGDLARVDANLAQSEQLAAQTELLEADKTLRQAEQAFRHLTGGSAPDALPAEQAQADTLETPAPIPSEHPQLEALRAASALAGSRVALVDTNRRGAPEIALSWISERSQIRQPYERAIGIKLTLPLSSSAHVQQDSAAARAELAQADTELSLTTSRLEQDIETARSALADTDRQLAMSRERQSLSADSLALAQRSFDLGESDLPALMRARADARDADIGVQRQLVAHGLALSRLNQARGIWP